MKISREEMKRREDIVRAFFVKNPHATVQEVNEHLANLKEKRMGQRAYAIRTEVQREAKKAGKLPNGPRVTVRARVPRTANVPRIHAPTPALAPPAADADAKLAQDVMAILGDLAKRVAGSRIQSVFLNVSGEVPVVKLLELEPREREVRLGESTASLAAPSPDRAAPVAAPTAAPAPQDAPVAAPAPSAQ